MVLFVLVLSLSCAISDDSDDDDDNASPTTSETPSPSASPTPATVSIPAGSATPGCELTDSCYLPFSVSISVGQSVTWTNDDVAQHSAISGDQNGGGPDGVFGSGLIAPGASFEFTFDTTGTYPYYCLIHPWQVGKETVQ